MRGDRPFLFYKKTEGRIRDQGRESEMRNGENTSQVKKSGPSDYKKYLQVDFLLFLPFFLFTLVSRKTL